MALPASRAARLPVRPARPRLRAVRAPVSRRRGLPFFLLSVVLVAGLILTLTSAQALLAQGAFRLSTLGRQAERLELEGDMLRLRLARLSSPERVAAAARRSGLVTPERVEILGAP
ncbi:MAG: septum formation initiator family protein [Actinomycetota bacterium]